MASDFERKKTKVLSASIALLVISCISMPLAVFLDRPFWPLVLTARFDSENLGIAFGAAHLGKYESHRWVLIIGDWSYVGRYTGDGIWGCGLGVIGAILGISAGCMADYRTFKSLYIAQSVFVSFKK